MKTFIMFVCAVLTAGIVSAQTVNPRSVAFTASPDHATNIGGVDILTSYQLDVMVSNSTGALAFTKGLGKPTPDATNTITVTVPEFVTQARNTYVAIVSAVGPGGSTKSVPSDPFVSTGPPTAPGKPVVK